MSFCPRCRQEIPATGAVCPDHGLYGVQEAALARGEDAPLLGYVLDERYVLIDYLGGGGMGAVYQGRQLTLDRVVAIKVMHASLTATREDRKRFEEEARALSLLQSPHSVTLHDYGVVRDGPLAHMAYMVLEFVEGETLAQRARGGVLSPETIAAIVDGVADALDEAHAHGIVHRDIKPANIILSHDHRGAPLVKLIDFGVASFGGRTGLTRTGFSVGTPSYMAPEQFDADGSAGLDGRADVYAMGVVCYAVLTGQKPFLSNSVLELARLHRSSPPPRVPGADGDGRLLALEGVLHRALAKEPTARYPSMGAFARAFRDAVAVPVNDTGEEPVVETVRVARAMPIVVGPPEAALPTPTESFVGALEKSGPVPRTRRRGWVLLVAILFVCGAGGALLADFLTREETPSLAAAPVVETVAAPTEESPASAAPVSVALAEVPVSATPLSAAPITAAPITTAPITAAPITAAPASRAPASQAPRTAPPERAIRRPERPVDPQLQILADQIEGALKQCGCRAARATLSELRGRAGGAALAQRYARKVSACVVPDVDETCRDGKVISP